MLKVESAPASRIPELDNIPLASLATEFALAMAALALAWTEVRALLADKTLALAVDCAPAIAWFALVCADAIALVALELAAKADSDCADALCSAI